MASLQLGHIRTHTFNFSQSEVAGLAYSQHSQEMYLGISEYQEMSSTYVPYLSTYHLR